MLPGGARVVALTFDAGGSDKGLTSILNTLAQEKATASFFLTGRFALAFPQQSRTIARGYPVGNHTQTHPDLTRLTAAAVRSELRTAATNIRAVTGVDPRPYFRFPFGARDAATIGLVNAECYVPFRWTVDTLGWKGTSGGMTADKVYQRAIDGLRPGAVVLMHVGANPDDGSTLDADALRRIIQRIRAEGYTLVTLEATLPAAP